MPVIITNRYVVFVSDKEFDEHVAEWEKKNPGKRYPDANIYHKSHKHYENSKCNWEENHPERPYPEKEDPKEFKERIESDETPLAEELEERIKGSTISMRSGSPFDYATSILTAMKLAGKDTKKKKRRKNNGDTNRIY